MARRSEFVQVGRVEGERCLTAPRFRALLCITTCKELYLKVQAHVPQSHQLLAWLAASVASTTPPSTSPKHALPRPASPDL
eukprot:357286-Chlamydomonas_euryale.AAC.15